MRMLHAQAGLCAMSVREAAARVSHGVHLFRMVRMVRERGFFLRNLQGTRAHCA
jgi:acetolactate synthase regulatory subunit